MDRRVRKTRQALAQAFLALEHQKPVDQITVAELCNLADIGRGTFYLHYSDVAGLQRDLVDLTITAFIEQFAAAPPTLLDGSYRDWLNSLLAYLQAHKAEFSLVHRSSESGAVAQSLMAAFGAQLSGDAATTRFLVAGGIGLVSGWLNGDIDCEQAAVVALLDARLRQ